MRIFRLLLGISLFCQLHGDSFGFQTPEYSFQALRAIEATAGGGADIGECLQTFSQIQDGDDAGWYRAWHELARRLEQEAKQSEKEGHIESARSASLRASNYYRTAEFFLHTNPTDPRIVATSKKAKSCFLQAVKGLDVHEVKIPFEGTYLPGYFCKGGEGKRSFGGYLVPRALAFEKRVKVGMANGGIYDFHEACMQKDKNLEALLDVPEACVEIDNNIQEMTKKDASLRWVFGNGLFTFQA